MPQPYRPTFGSALVPLASPTPAPTGASDPQPVPATPKGVRVLFPSPKSSETTPSEIGVSIVIPGSHRRNRILVSAQALQESYDLPLGVCEFASAGLKYIDLALSDKLGVDSQNRFAGYTKQLLEISTNPVIAQASLAVDSVIADIRRSDSFRIKANLQKHLLEIAVKSDSLPPFVEPLTRLRISTDQLCDLFKQEQNILSANWVMVRYLNLVDRELSLATTIASCKIAVGQCDNLHRTIDQHLKLIQSTTIGTIPAWSLKMISVARAERTNIITHLLSELA